MKRDGFGGLNAPPAAFLGSATVRVANPPPGAIELGYDRTLKRGAWRRAIGGRKLSDWIDTLAREARRLWEDGKRLLLLSQVPTYLASQKIDVVAARNGRPLRTAVEADADGRVKLFERPGHSAVHAVLPKDLAEKLNAETIFERSSAAKPLPLSPAGATSFKPWFWAAFIKSLPPGKRRWITSERFLDLGKDESPQAGAREVLPDDIQYPGPGVTADRDIVLAAIHKWAVRNEVDRREFEASAATAHAPAPATKMIARAASSPFDLLEPEDLRRIYIPLDIVMKLIRR